MRGIRLAAGGVDVTEGLSRDTGGGGAERPWPEATGWTRLRPGTDPLARVPWPSGAGQPPALGWLGHSGFVLDWHGQRLLLDPHLGSRVTVARRLLERPVTPRALGTVDAALISHAHADHLDPSTLGAVPALRTVVVPRGTEPDVAGLGPAVRIIGLREGERLRIGPLEITAVPAAHHGARHHPFPSAGRRALGYVVRHRSSGLYFAGDTGPSNDFARIGAAHRPLVAILPIGAYAPRALLSPYHLTPEGAVEAALALGRPVVVPCHFGTFRLSLDRPWVALPRFALAASHRGLAWVMPRLVRPAGAAGGAG